MPSRPVACKGAGKATASLLTTYNGRPGSWAITPSTSTVEEVYDEIVVEGAKALKKVSASFTFTATDTSPPTTLPAITVDLLPKSAVLKAGGAAVLLDGDNEKKQGNMVEVSSSRPLKSE
jgi:hypothetical protein